MLTCRRDGLSNEAELKKQETQEPQHHHLQEQKAHPDNIHFASMQRTGKKDPLACCLCGRRKESGVQR